MQLDTPEGRLTIDDDTLTFEPADSGPTLVVSLSPMPNYDYQRSIYGMGGLSIGGAYVVLRNEQAEEVVTELRRPRESKPSKPTSKSDDRPATPK